MKKVFYLLLVLFCGGCGSIVENRGEYFAKKSYDGSAIPMFEAVRGDLPQPVISDAGLVEMYWKCWEIAFANIKKPEKRSPFVSNWLDEAFSPNIFQWDTIFMVMFARYGHHVFPAVQSFDNFYCMQRESGYICREYREKDGAEVHFDFVGGLFSKHGRKNSINPPVFSWAEVESYKVTGDKSRFEAVFPVLEKYAQWLNRDGDPLKPDDWENNGRRSHDSVHSLYWNTPLGCGMDNSPRAVEYGMGWIDMSSQMVLMYRNLAIMAKELGLDQKAAQYSQEADEISVRINKWCWDEEDGVYYDVSKDGKFLKKKTAGTFWPLVAGVPNSEQARRLVAKMMDSSEFYTKIPFATLSASEPEFKDDGGYWNGGVWAPTNYVAVKGLEQYGYEEEALKASSDYLAGMYEVFKETSTVWENYAPTTYAPGSPSKGDFVGWTGIGPITFLIENVLGFRPDGINNSLVWNITREDRHGIKNLVFGGVTASLICDEISDEDDSLSISVESNSDFSLKVVAGEVEEEFSVKKGSSKFDIKLER
ncbi:MAG: hypothetical protein JXR63_12155 [Spirochaetales bacterium]|nr:hypothetical protein [Spirochaetales bacterium]